MNTLCLLLHRRQNKSGTLSGTEPGLHAEPAPWGQAAQEPASPGTSLGAKMGAWASSGVSAGTNLSPLCGLFLKSPRGTLVASKLTQQLRRDGGVDTKKSIPSPISNIL